MFVLDVTYRDCPNSNQMHHALSLTNLTSSPRPPWVSEQKIRLFELDVKEMFPRLDRKGVIEGVKQVYDAVIVASREGGPRGRGKRIRKKGPTFAVHNKNRKLDKIGIGYSGDYTNVSWEDIATYMNYDLFDSDFFVVGNHLFRQKKGIAIGRIISAQLAELFCMGKELQILSQTKEAQARQQAKYLPPKTLVLHPYRFRDNTVGVIKGKIGLKRVQSWFECLYGLDLQIEGEGLVLPSLEASIS